MHFCLVWLVVQMERAVYVHYVALWAICIVEGSQSVC